MAILAILASITITVGRGIHERSQIARAKADLAVLAAALEAYKAQYGDYPWTPATPPTPLTDGGAIMFNALCGNLGPKANAALATKGRTFVELAKFAVDDPADLPDPTLTTLKNNWFNDPWGKWYYYHYKKSASDTDWQSPGFLLYSHGPDGLCNIGSAADTGILDAGGGMPVTAEWIAKNADNIYYGRN